MNILKWCSKLFEAAAGVAFGLLLGCTALQVMGQEILPFAPTPSGSTAGPTLQDSTYSPLPQPKRLPADAPNILIILIDDAGPGLPSTYGGEVNTPTLTRITKEGIAFNRFHTCAMCSPTRASLLTGRNSHRVGNGQIAELGNDWDGYSGVIPKTSATVAEVLKDYGYCTAAFGKWHNTPAEQVTAQGPFDYWPTGYGFQYFYGFLGGETSQYEPTLVKNTAYIHPPKTPEQGYTLNDDLADQTIHWLHEHKAFDPDKPFFIYYATGAVHGPFHVPQQWTDKYRGKFDDGWDAYRQRVFNRQKQMGWLPQSAQLTPRDPTMDSWDSIPDSEKPFQRRLMELFAGFGEQTDYDIGRVVDEIDKIGYRDNTLIMYIWGDNGSSSEGQSGSISELLVQNGIPSTPAQHIAALNSLGGLDALGTPKTDPMYNAGWAWAGSTPYKGTKLVAAYFGGTRNPMAVRWPAKIKPDPTPRTQFHHVNDIVPTIYDVVGITPPAIVNGFPQDSFDGVSMAYTFNDPTAKDRKHTQYFEVMGSRAIYHDGWMASVFGPRIPWVPGVPKGIADWSPDKDKWELYNLDEDWSQANDLADKMPDKLASMKDIFMAEAAKNNALPIGGGLWVPVYHPELRKSTPYTEWTFTGDITGMPEFAAPALGNKPNVVTIDAQIPDNANGVLYSLGGFSGGLACYMQDGKLCYEYNLFEIMRTQIKSKDKLPAGKVQIEVDTDYVVRKAAGPLKIVMKVGGKEVDTATTVNGKEVASTAQVDGVDVAPGMVPVSAPLAFTANGCFNVGTNPGSPVSDDYYDKAPFTFNGTIDTVNVKYMK